MLQRMPIQTVTLPAILILWVGLIVLIVAMVAARRRKGASGVDTAVRQRNASWIWLALQGVAVGVAFFGPMRISSDALAPAQLLRDAIVLALMAGLVGLFHSATLAMGRNWAVVARTRDDHELVQSGPFAYVRHPIYVGFFLYLLAAAVACGHLANLLIAVPLYWFATWLRIRHEEAILREQFGEAYDAYAARVKRFVPGVI